MLDHLVDRERAIRSLAGDDVSEAGPRRTLPVPADACVDADPESESRADGSES